MNLKNLRFQSAKESSLSIQVNYNWFALQPQALPGQMSISKFEFNILASLNLLFPVIYLGSMKLPLHLVGTQTSVIETGQIIAIYFQHLNIHLQNR